MNSLNMMSGIKAILFDVGGILIQKQKHPVQDMKVIHSMLELLSSEVQPEAFITQVKKGETAYKAFRMQTLMTLENTEKWTRFILPDFPKNIIIQHATELQHLWKDSFGERQLTSGAIETLTALAARGYILATVSHTDPNMIKSAEIRKLFKTNICASDFGIRKPHPSIFISAAEACGVPSQACAYIGDRPSRDIIGSRVAGMGMVVMIENDHSTHESDSCPMAPDVRIDDISKLLTLFEGSSDNILFETSPQHLYDCALSTAHQKRESETLNQFFVTGRSLGFSRIELNYQVLPDDFASMDLDHTYFGTLHNPCPAIRDMKALEREGCLLSSRDRSKQQVAIDVLKNTIDTAYHLGARSVVIHPGMIECDHELDHELRSQFRQGKKGTPGYQAIKQQLIADRKQRSAPHLDALTHALDEIVHFSAGSNLMLGIENLLAYYEMPSFDELNHLLNTFTQPWFGWQLDLGHIIIQENLGLELLSDWMETFSARMVGVHFHDVRGLEDHMAPGMGDVDFTKLPAYIPPFAQLTVEVRPEVADEELKNCLPFLETQGCITKLF